MKFSIWTLLLGALFLTLCAPSVADSNNLSREYELLKELSPTAVSFLGKMSDPDENGHMGANRGGRWIEVGTQRSGCRSLIGAVMRGDTEQADSAWRAIETAFDHQLDDGGFESAPAPGSRFAVPLGDRVDTAFFFLQELARAILIVEASPMADHFEDRLAALEPKLRAATDFIQGRVDGIIWKVGHTANRLLIAAKAFGLCGLVLEDEQLKASSLRLVEEALDRRDEDGIFIECDGRDSSYTAVSLLMGQVLLLYLPHAELEKAMDVNMAWLRTRIDQDGKVSTENNTRTGVGREFGLDGKPKNINVSEVAQALAYYGTIQGDADVIALAEKVAAPKKRAGDRQAKADKGKSAAK